MKKALSVLLVLILCLPLCACGNQDKYKKYDALIGYIEAGDSGNAINEVLALIGQNGPEETEAPEVVTTTVEITMDNWQEYFELAICADILRNAFKEIDMVGAIWKISLKEEYREQLMKADVAFAWHASEYGSCTFFHDLNTGLTTYSDFASQKEEPKEGTCAYVYDSQHLYMMWDFSVGLENSFAVSPPLEANDNGVTWKGQIFTSVEITRVQGTLTLKVE